MLKHLDVTCIEVSGARRYSTPAGVFPSVTTILRATKDMSGLDRWRKRVGEKEADRILRESSARGKLVHAILEKYLLEGVEGSGPWWDSMQPVLQDISNVQLVEGPLYHAGVGFAGTADFIAHWRGVLTLGDWKTARKRRDKRQYVEDYFLQAAAYTGAANVHYNLNIAQAAVFIALKDEPAQVFVLNRDELISYWLEFRNRAKMYASATTEFLQETFA